MTIVIAKAEDKEVKEEIFKEKEKESVKVTRKTSDVRKAMYGDGKD